MFKKKFIDFTKVKRYALENIILLTIMLFSLLIRAYYVSRISIYQNQHDAGNIYEEGNLAYFAYLIRNQHLPDFDVGKVDQFWHPPLYYIITAAVLKVSWFSFPSQEGNYEIAQIVPFLCITASIFLIWKILLIIFPKDVKIVNLALCYAAFQPSFLMRSAILNSDAMATFITIAMLYVLLRHIHDPQKRDIVVMLILFSIGMWTKKSVLICAITIGIVLLYELIYEKRTDFYKALVIGIASLPISMGWYIRLKLRWDIPFNYIWMTDGNVAPDYIEGVSVIRRLTDFALAHFGYQYTYIRNNTEGIDINPFTVMVKTSANDLWIWSYANDGITKLSYMLVLIRLLCTVITVIGMIFFVADSSEAVRNKCVVSKTKIAILSYFVLAIISFYVFAFQSPFVCSMDFRYIEPVILCEAIAVGKLAEKKTAYVSLLFVTVMMASALLLKICLYQY